MLFNDEYVSAVRGELARFVLHLEVVKFSLEESIARVVVDKVFAMIKEKSEVVATSTISHMNHMGRESRDRVETAKNLAMRKANYPKLRTAENHVLKISENFILSPPMVMKEHSI
jgi:hypothetical protein